MEALPDAIALSRLACRVRTFVGQDSNRVIRRILSDTLRIVSHDRTGASLCHRLAALPLIAATRLHLALLIPHLHSPPATWSSPSATWSSPSTTWHSSFAICHSSSAICHLSSAARHPPSFAICHSSSAIWHLSSAARHPPSFAICHSSSAIWHLSSAARHPPSFAICHSSSAIWHLSSAARHPPSFAICHLPSGICHPPFPHSPFQNPHSAISETLPAFASALGAGRTGSGGAARMPGCNPAPRGRTARRPRRPRFPR